MLNRRQFIQSASAMGAAGMMGLPNFANAATVNGKRTALLLVMMNGGYAPIQTSARSFIDNTAAQMGFGCTSSNIIVNDQISYDAPTWGKLPKKAIDRMAAIGSIGASNHNSAKHFWEGAEGGLPQAIASAMGGPSAIKAAKVGDVTGAPGGSVGGVSLESVKDMGSALEALTGKGQTIAKDDRAIMGGVVDETYKRFEEAARRNPRNLSSLIDGYKNLVKSMTTPVEEVDQAEIKAAYTGTYSLNGKLAIAEALMRSGVNVVCVGEGAGTYWDTHDDNQGAKTRTYFDLMVPALSTFCDRMLGRDDMNVSIVFVSEHSRIPLINNHGPHISTIVISDNVIGGRSTGITDNGGLIPDADKKPVQAWKAAVGELVGLKGSENPFGTAAQHRCIMKYPSAAECPVLDELKPLVGAV